MDAEAEAQPAGPEGPFPGVALAVATGVLFAALLGAALWRFSLGHAYGTELGFNLNVAWNAISGNFGGWSHHAYGTDRNLHFIPLGYLVDLTLFRLVPRPETLLAVQALVLALGLPLAFEVGRQALGDDVGGWTTAGVYLLTPSLFYVNQFDYHPVTMAVPAVLLAAAGVLRGSRPMAAAGLVLLLLVREDTGLTAAWAGVVLALCVPGWRRFGLLAALGAGLAWLAIILWIHPAMMGTAAHPQWQMNYPHLGGSPGGVVRSLLFSPLEALSSSFSPRKLASVGIYLAPTLGVTLLGAEALAVGLPFLGYAYLSVHPTFLDPRAHYCAVFFPLLPVAFALGLRRLESRLGPTWRRRVALAALASSLAIWLGLQAAFPATRREYRPQHWVPHLEKLQALVGPEDSVLASNGLYVHFAQRKQVSLYGLVHQDPDPPDFDWILLSLWERNYPRFLGAQEEAPQHWDSLLWLADQGHPERYEVAFAEDGVVALRRDREREHPETWGRIQDLRLSDPVEQREWRELPRRIMEAAP